MFAARKINIWSTLSIAAITGLFAILASARNPGHPVSRTFVGEGKGALFFPPKEKSNKEVTTLELDFKPGGSAVLPPNYPEAHTTLITGDSHLSVSKDSTTRSVPYLNHAGHRRQTRSILTSPFNNCPKGWKRVIVGKVHTCLPKNPMKIGSKYVPYVEQAHLRQRRSTNTAIKKCKRGYRLLVLNLLGGVSFTECVSENIVTAMP